MDISFDESVPIKPIEQLLIVTPIQHSNILPWSFQQIYKDFDHQSFKLDVLKGGKNIYSDPILPDINRSEIEKLMINIPVTEIEMRRNTVKSKIFCMKF